MEAWLRGFSLTLTVSPLPNPAFATNGEMSDMELFSRDNSIRLIKPATGEMSDIELPESPRIIKLVKPASGEMSDIELSESSSHIRVV